MSGTVTVTSSAREAMPSKTTPLREQSHLRAIVNEAQGIVHKALR
jgi:hypothetical protein